ncbi:MAG: CDP-diacylglycerol--serine O-phosphatidyltransferase [Methanosarcinales archaeon]|nr:CDP-diacylglycerol--serine O-phosphatidyltransferase [ANME-2 cluster archaeon]MDW7776156.1 CDP-diacylglycerol--serine O-phosphatidyltransferase [Methanosarcinales archaeon]
MHQNNENPSIYKLIRLPDLVTLLNALLGLTAILMVVQSPSNVLNASMLIILAVIADGADGAIARRLEYGVLGEHLDSLADVISFGIAPVVIAFALLAPQYHYPVCIIGGAFLASGILRLARFGVIDQKGGFIGMPITTSGLMVSLYVLAFSSGEGPLFSYGLLATMLLLSVLMVSRIRYPKVRDARLIGVMTVLLILMVVSFYLGSAPGLMVTARANLVLIGVYILSPLLNFRKKR